MTERDGRCVFCEWARGASPSLVLEDEHTVVGVDARQPHPGHVLIIPRRHLPTVFDLDDAVAAAVMKTTARVARAVRGAFAPEGLSLWQSNGPAAFQEIPHFHMHVMPRWRGDGLLRIYPRRIENIGQHALEEQAAAIRGHLDG